jgi:hypothetical protein
MTTELKQLTPEIIREWNTEIKGDVLILKRQSGYICPLSNKFVTARECRICVHNFGDASPRHIYCVPETEKQIGARTARKKQFDRFV